MNEQRTRFRAPIKICTFIVHTLFSRSTYVHLRIYFALTYQLARRIRVRRRHPRVLRSPRRPYPVSARLWVFLQEYETDEGYRSEWKSELISQECSQRLSCLIIIFCRMYRLLKVYLSSNFQLIILQDMT